VDDDVRLERRRFAWAIGLNLIAPGAGLVILRREWFGLTVATLFALLAQTGLYGSIVDPTLVRADGARFCGAAAVVVWIFAQAAAIFRARKVLGQRARREIASIVHQASDALEERRYVDAVDLLNVALHVNDESSELRIALARVLTVMGQFDKARSVWESVLDLDVRGDHRAEAIGALERLPQEGSV